MDRRNDPRLKAIKATPGTSTGSPAPSATVQTPGRASALDGTHAIDPSAIRLRMLSKESQEQLRLRLRDLLGETIIALMDDETVTDIMRNPDGCCYVKRIGKKPERLDVEHSDHTARLVIAQVESAYGGELLANNPHVERAMPWANARFTGTLPPRTTNPFWTIRLFNRLEVRLADYVKTDRASKAAITVVQKYIDNHFNLLIAGSQGHGKTTYLEALLHEVAARHPDTRFATIQDTNEIKLINTNGYTLFTEDDNPHATWARQIKASLRYGATSLTLGEIREQAFALLEAWTTGTTRTGGATIHGDSPAKALRRLEFLLTRDNIPINGNTREAIREAVGGIIVLGYPPGGLPGTIMEIVRITEATDVGYRFTKEKI